MRSRIGITCSTTIHEERELQAIETAYVNAVLRAGGLPLVLPALGPSDAADVAGALDGLVLAGGGDVEPSRYGEAPAAEVAGVEPRRDDFELALVGAATARDLPILGICRGLQLVNVARGGTLLQHIPAVTGTVHRLDVPDVDQLHPVSVVPGAGLTTLLGTAPFAVNSLHHQAVDTLGAGLVVAARSLDGVVEALVADDGTRLVGVQWHPELLDASRSSAALFDWVVTEAARPVHALPPVAPLIAAS